MKNIRKTLSIILALLLVFSFASCKQKETEKDFKIVATIFPEYDWVCEVLGERISDVSLTLLLDSGVDLHSYQPTADDIITISTCDLFIYVGGESDEWVDDVLSNATNKNMKVINLLEILGEDAKEEEEKEGMQGEDHDHVGEDHDEEPEYDEHVWLSLKNAKLFVKAICDELCNIDAENKNSYESNSNAYIEKLSQLNNEYEEFAKSSSKDTLVFADRFPFRYLVEDYGFDYYAAFSGCSAESEASFETITFLANKVDEKGANTIFILEGSSQKIADTVISCTKSKDQKIATLNSMQGTTIEQVKNGAKYLSIMQENLEVIKEALK